MKHLKTFEGFLFEASVPPQLKKLGDWQEVDSSDIEVMYGDTVKSYQLITGTGLDDYGLIVNVYDNKVFSIFYDSWPQALSSHTPDEKRKMEQTGEEFPLPLAKLTKDELNTVIAEHRVKEGNTFVYTAAKARRDEKKEFKFRNKTYPVTIGDTKLKESISANKKHFRKTNESAGRYLGTKNIPSYLKSIGSFYEIEPAEYDGEFGNIRSFGLETKTKLDDVGFGGIIINIHDDEMFSIYFDSWPYPVSAHSTTEVRNMSQTGNPVPLPISKLTKKELDAIVQEIYNKYF